MDRMNILHVVEDFSFDSGGLRTVIERLNFHLNQQEGFSSYILSSKKEKEDTIEIVKAENAWLYSANWEKEIIRIILQKEINIVHIHGVWMYPQYISAKICVKKNIPFLLSTHGMYEPWLWKKGTLKKKLYYQLLIKNLFKKAELVHAITASEKTNLFKYFKGSSIVQIPNLIDETQEDFTPVSAPERYILFLGRITKVKGLDILLKAFATLNNKSFKLLIAGKFSDYKKELEKMITDLNIENQIEFKGLVTGPEKQELIRNAFAMVTPSYSEVIGMVNLEGGIQGTPVITTFQTGLDEEWSTNGGILIHPTAEELTFALKTVTNWDVQKRNENGEKLKNFVKQRYSWTTRIKDWLQTYKEVSNA